MGIFYCTCTNSIYKQLQIVKFIHITHHDSRISNCVLITKEKPNYQEITSILLRLRKHLKIIEKLLGKEETWMNHAAVAVRGEGVERERERKKVTFALGCTFADG